MLILQENLATWGGNAVKSRPRLHGKKSCIKNLTLPGYGELSSVASTADPSRGIQLSIIQMLRLWKIRVCV